MSNESEDEQKFVHPYLPLSTFDQILLNATETETKRLNQNLKLKATTGGKFFFAHNEYVPKTNKTGALRKQKKEEVLHFD